MEAFKKVTPENEEDILDTKYPRTYGFIRLVVYLAVLAITFVTWLCIFLIAFSCVPIVTGTNGQVIHTQRNKIAVVHENANKRKKVVVRYYAVDSVHSYKVGDMIKISSTPPIPNEPVLMADMNNQ